MLSIISSTDQQSKPSFWDSPAMRTRIARGGWGVQSSCGSDITSKSEAYIEEIDLGSKIEDLKILKISDRSQIDPTINKPEETLIVPNDNPDGLNDKIKGQYAQLLKSDPLYLQARSWGVHPALLTDATKRHNSDWVRNEIAFVAGNPKVGNKRAYVSKLLRA